MGRRIEVELTSSRDDGSWTWRAAGAKQPKGDVASSLLYEGAKVGDVVKVEAEFHLDGIEVVEVFAPRRKKERTDLLEMKSRPLRDDELVTTQRVPRNERRGDRRGGRGDRSRTRDDRGGGRRGERRGPRPEADKRPKPKRLRPRRTHRDALLAEVTEEHRPIVEQVMRDGMPGVRAAIEKQNTEAKAAGKPEVDASPILAIAERNLAKARLAEWRDRADAALADAAELDIRDLRSVVVAGTDVARDDETRALVDQIKEVLDGRLESDHATWLKDLEDAVSEGRVVRGLRLSSRPVKAGAPLPTEVAAKLSQQASEALAPDVMQDRWATVLDALAFSPVRGAVTPVGIPAEPKEELLAEVRRLSDRIPAIAGLFGIDPAQVPKSAKRRRPPRKGKNAGSGGGGGGGGGARRSDKPMRPVPGAEPKQAEQPAAEAEAEAATAAAPGAEAVADTAATEAMVSAETGAPTPADEPTPEEPAATEESTPADEPTPEEPAAPEEPAVTEEPPAAEEPAPADEPTPEEPAAAGEPAPADEPTPEEPVAAEVDPAQA
ncbi:MAG: hypothetical protein AAF547_17500 [Actinomycetota bacterium]